MTEFERRVQQWREFCIGAWRAHEPHLLDKTTVCGGPDADTHCDPIATVFFEELERLFPDADAGVFLAEIPDLLEWSDGQGNGIRETITSALRDEAEEQVFGPPGESMHPDPR